MTLCDAPRYGFSFYASTLCDIVKKMTITPHHCGVLGLSEYCFGRVANSDSFRHFTVLSIFNHSPSTGWRTIKTSLFCDEVLRV